jgi:hypothetical protein
LVDAKPRDLDGADHNESVGGGIWNAADDSASVTMTVEEMRKELFESEDVVMDKNSDHGLSKLTSGAGDVE